MLSDKSIQRDYTESYVCRMVLIARSRLSKKARNKLNVTIKEKLSKVDFTIFSNNCLGGVFYHDADKQFTSPLINTALDGDDFIRFLERPEYYLKHEMEFITWKGHNYPIARIDDIEVRFVHYKSNEEAESKWRERSDRIIWDNIYVIATNHDGLGREILLERFNQLPYLNKILFVSREYPQYDWAICVPQFKNRFQVKIMTNIANFQGQRYYELVFDIPQWILENSPNRGDKHTLYDQTIKCFRGGMGWQ